MKIAIVTFDGFNEIDSFVAAHIFNRVERPGWKAEITAPTRTVTSMNGVTISARQPLEFLSEANAVIFGSGRKTSQVLEDGSLTSRIRVSPEHQLVASQCSGALVLAHLGTQRYPCLYRRTNQTSAQSSWSEGVGTDHFMRKETSPQQEDVYQRNTSPPG